MGLGEVKHAIEEKTRLEVQTILNSGQVEADKIIADAERQIAKKSEANAAKTQEMMDALERKELAAANFSRKSILLEEKRRALDAVFSRVHQRLIELPHEQRAALLANLVAKAAVAMNISKVSCHSRDADILRDLFPAATISTDEHISGGFLADNAENTIRLDYTFDTMLDTLRERHIAELNRALFT